MKNRKSGLNVIRASARFGLKHYPVGSAAHHGVFGICHVVGATGLKRKLEVLSLDEPVEFFHIDVSVRELKPVEILEQVDELEKGLVE